MMKQNQPLQVVISGLEEPTRLDRAIRNQFPRWGRRAVQSLVNAGKVKVNERKVWLCSWVVQNGDRLEITGRPANKPESPAAFDEQWIIAQEDDLVALNKPAGLLSQATRWKQSCNLLDLAIGRFGPLSLFHRLDRDTSGVVLLTRRGAINRYLDAAFKAGQIKKEYIAIIPAQNNLSSAGSIETRIGAHPKHRDMMAVVTRGGKRAMTQYRLGHKVAGKQVVQMWPETGRTHQLRLHLLHLGAPILGDRLYGPPRQKGGRLMLHAYQISLPASNEFPPRTFTAPIPEDFLLR